MAPTHTNPTDFDLFLARLRALAAERDDVLYAILVVEPDVEGIYHVLAWCPGPEAGPDQTGGVGEPTFCPGGACGRDPEEREQRE